MSSNPDEWFGATKQDPNRVRTMWVDVKDPGLRSVLGVPEGGMPLQDFMGIASQQPIPQQAQVQPGFGTSIKRGTATSLGDIATTFAWMTQEMPQVSEYFQRKADDLKLRAEALPRAVPTIEDAEDVGDYVTWGVETLGEQVPFIASILLPGGVASGVAKLAGAGAKVAKAAGYTAAFLADAGLMTGESIGIAQDNQGDVNDLRVVGSGLGKAVLDFIPFFMLAKTVGLAKPFETAIIKRLAQQGYLKRAAGNAALLVASEVPTETMQEVINIELDNYFTGYNGPITDEQKSQLYNAAAGASLFGVFGLYAPKAPPPSGITDEETSDVVPDYSVNTPQLTLQPQTDFTFTNVPTGIDSPNPGGFDFRNLYDPRTGELRTTAQDYMRIVQEQTQVKYDATLDTVALPSSSAQYTTIVPGWQERGGAWYLDAPKDNANPGRAMIAPEAGGFHGWDVYGNDLGLYPDLTSAQIAATQQVYAKTKAYVFDQDGMHIQAEPDQHQSFVQSFGQAITPTEQAAVKIEEARPQRAPNELREPSNEAAVSEMVNDPELMKLLDTRDEFINNKDNYRTSDGEMKKGAAARLKGLDERIARLAKMKGVTNPSTGDVIDVEGTKIDETLATVTNAEQDKAAAPKYANLTAFEIKQFDDLLEREQFEGLSTKQYESLARLKLKAETGSDVYGEYREASLAELNEFNAQENAMLKKVRKHRSKFSKATREIAKMRGIQLAKRGGPQITVEEVDMDMGDFDYYEQEWKQLGYESLEDMQKNPPTSLWKATNVETGEVSGPFRSKEDALTRGRMARPGWREVNSDDVVAINPQAKASLHENSNGTFEATKIDDKGNVWSLGHFASREEAMSVAEGATPSFVAEVQQAIKGFWQTFNIRPRLYVLSTSDIINNKVRMLANTREALLNGYGLFQQGEPGTIYIHVDSHKNVADTIKTLVHEMIVHFGLRATMTHPHWNAILSAYANYNRDRIKSLEAEGFSEDSVAARQAGENAVADVLSADEAIAYTAMKKYTGDPIQPFEQKFLDRVIATFRAWYRSVVMRTLPKSWQQRLLNAVPYNDKDVTKLLIDTAAAMRNGDINAKINTTYVNRQIVQSAKAHSMLEESMDSFSSVWTAKAAGLFLQPLQFAERYNVPGVQSYINFVQKWAARKASLQNAPVQLVEKWQNYSKAKSNNLAKALLEMTAASDAKINRTGEALTDEERQQILKQNGVVDQEGQELFKEIRDSFMKLLNQLEVSLQKQLLRREAKDAGRAKELWDAYVHDSKTPGASQFGDVISKYDLKDFNLGERMMKTQAQINALRKRDYFPYMRFGRYAVWVRSTAPFVLDGKKYKGPQEGKAGQMVHFETYETYADMKQAALQIEKEYGAGPTKGRVKIGTGLVSDEEHTLMGMPPALYDALKDNLGLNEKQQEMLKEIYYTTSPGQRFLRNMVQRKGVKGFSSDAIRVYSSYMLNAAGHIARIENGTDMDAAVAEIARYANEGGINAGAVRDYWAKHYKYIMSPENDWAGLRAVGFLWYLGFNIKSAAVNLTQVPMVAYPYLGARFGDAKALSALTRGYKEAFRILKANALPKTELEFAIQQGIEEGFLDESLATVLAGFSESSVLQRIAPETDAQRRLNQVAWAGSWMFRHVESINRYTTFIAAWKLSKEAGKNNESAFAEAKEAIQGSMFEYAKWNRASFARGKKSVFFLFWSYMQGLAYLMGGGKGKKTALRVWTMMMLAAGYQGIPFADNILDLFDWGSRELKEALGLDDPYTDSRTELRKLAQNITDNPDLLLHGWSKHYGLGPVHLLALAGVPVPEVDLSGSLAVGRWLPGTDKLTSNEKDPDKKLGQTLVDVLGPVAGIGYGMFRALNDRNPDTWKVWERAMPSALKSASQAIRRSSTGAEEFRGGGAIAEWDPTNPEDRMSLALNMLGFQPSRVSGAYQAIGAKENLRRYWTGRQAMVMENWAFAKRSGDPELMADAREAMHEFNEQVPDSKLRLDNEKIRRSMKARQQKVKLREMGLPSEKGYRRLYEEIDRIYGLQ